MDWTMPETFKKAIQQGKSVSQIDMQKIRRKNLAVSSATSDDVDEQVIV